MAPIFQMTFSNALYWMKMFEFRLTSRWILLTKFQQYPSIGSDDGLAQTRRQAIIWTNDGYFTAAYMLDLVSMN